MEDLDDLFTEEEIHEEAMDCQSSAEECELCQKTHKVCRRGTNRIAELHRKLITEHPEWFEAA